MKNFHTDELTLAHQQLDSTAETALHQHYLPQLTTLHDYIDQNGTAIFDQLWQDMQADFLNPAHYEILPDQLKKRQQDVLTLLAGYPKSLTKIQRLWFLLAPSKGNLLGDDAFFAMRMDAQTKLKAYWSLSLYYLNSCFGIDAERLLEA